MVNKHWPHDILFKKDNLNINPNRNKVKNIFSPCLYLPWGFFRFRISLRADWLLANLSLIQSELRGNDFNYSTMMHFEVKVRVHINRNEFNYIGFWHSM